ncbi:hypothetical protein [Sphingopyxis sp. GC21]|uniref:hypothetical protein n=1 Tax=Sphingopyxis sp. GC21 TaxID=2933562 RepID=UPI0021E4FD2B|nr:hypothetical protein [Sphingopyxis sp. GC21]
MAHVNKVHSVRTIGLVARELDKTEDEIADLALGMDPQDGLIWIYSPEHEDGIMAFTYDGVDNLETLIADQQIAKR